MNDKKSKLLLNVPQEPLLPPGTNLINNDGYKALMEAIQSKLDGMDSNIKSHYLVELYDNELVYKVQDSNSGEKLYKIDYEVNDNKIEFTGEPIEVRQEVTFTVNEEPLIDPSNLPAEKSADQKVREREFYPDGLDVDDELKERAVDRDLQIKTISGEPAHTEEALLPPIEESPDIKETKPLKKEE